MAMATGQHRATGSAHEHRTTTTRAAAPASKTLTPPHPRAATTPTKETSGKDPPFAPLDRLGAIEEHSDLGQGFHVAEKDMGIRGIGSMFGEQQSGDVANVGIDLFFDMLFDSLSKVLSF
ncbi:hypothetical protein TRIUR3_17793 [Triticum urartu]|uniref:Uncharacterized protein n=2 Tax=Triticum TaxID=4564 RepID=A0A9R0SAT1_TRITD|nr:hypothetical protein TRIUR3_17793 [Triticum urartu]VAH91872.1 unnamed protein product [Triticum turgidum subsp. durum]